MSGSLFGLDRDVTVAFDGGAIGNPGQGYGSYQVIWSGEAPQPVQRWRDDSGDRMTNNQAEYLSLMRGLIDVMNQPKFARRQTTLLITGDSKLVLEQVSGRWKVKNASLQSLSAETKRLLGEFQRFETEWKSRDHSVERFGH